MSETVSQSFNTTIEYRIVKSVINEDGKLTWETFKWFNSKVKDDEEAKAEFANAVEEQALDLNRVKLVRIEEKYIISTTVFDVV